MELFSAILLNLFLLIILGLWLLIRTKNGSSYKAQTSAEQAQRQLDYMRLMNTSPRLRGNSQFSVRVEGSGPFQENLQTVKAMLVHQYTVDSSFMAVLKVIAEEGRGKSRVIVSVGDEPVGFIPDALVGLVEGVLGPLGGIALAEARLADPIAVEGLELELDIEFPVSRST